MTQSEKGFAKIAEGASPRRHAETSKVKVKDTHLMNLYGDCENTWVPGRTWRASIVFRPTVTCCHLVSKMLFGQRTWRTYSLWVLMYIDGVCPTLLLISHCLHRKYIPTNVIPVVRSAVKCFTELSTQLNELFHGLVEFGLVEFGRINMCSSCHLWLDKCWLSLVQAEACCCWYQAIAWTNVNPTKPGYNWIFYTSVVVSKMSYFDDCLLH